MAGNTLGARKYFKYTTDTGDDYKYLTDENLGLAVGATKDDTLEDLPRRIKPRGVYCESSTGNRKFVVCPKTDTTCYNKKVTSALTIDGTTYNTTGRKGERMSFGSNNEPASP